MRELHALDRSRCSGGKADGAGYILGASALKVIGRETLRGAAAAAAADDIIRELLKESYNQGPRSIDPWEELYRPGANSPPY